MILNLKTAIEQFLIDQELKGNSQKTINYYRQNLMFFSTFIGEEKKVNEITLLDLKQYLLFIKNKEPYVGHPFKPKVIKPLSTVTIQTYARAIRCFVKYLYKEEYIPKDISLNFTLPKAQKTIVDILEDEEIKTIFKCFKTNTEIGLRNACIFALMLDCGLRRTEVIRIKTTNVNIASGFIKVLGKGNKERIVPLGLSLKKLLLKYMHGYRSMSIIDNDYLFIDTEFKPISDSALKQIFNRLRKRIKIKRLHAHLLRHTFSTKYLINGGDLFSLQSILGHTSLEMVRKYSHLASAYLIKAHKNFSPLDNLNNKSH